MADTVVDQVHAQVTNARTMLAMFVGAGLEGGSLGGPGTFGVGDQGTSFGPFQIHLPAHPDINQQQASDPAYAVKYMLPAYSAAAAQVPDSLWKSNPEQAAEQTAFIAERPTQDYYVARGQSTVDAAYQAAKSHMTWTSSSNDPGALAGGVIAAVNPFAGAAVQGAQAAAGKFGSLINDVIHPIETFLVNAGLVVLGIIAVLVAVVIMARSADTQTLAAGGGSEPSPAEDAAVAE